MEKKDAKMGRPKTALEPAVYVGVTKACPFCSSVDVEYKFLNNNKVEQPRYRCEGCKKLFTYNPTSRRKRHPRGYLKIASNEVASQDLPENDTVSCLNPSCGKVGTSRFLFYNNGKVSQPRYKCGVCDTTFTHGGRLILKKTRLNPSMPDVGECSAAGELVSSKRKIESSVQNVGENGERRKWRRSDDTADVVADPCGVEAIAQPKILRNTKKIHVLNHQFSREDEIGTTLKLCSWMVLNCDQELCFQSANKTQSLLRYYMMLRS